MYPCFTSVWLGTVSLGYNNKSGSYSQHSIPLVLWEWWYTICSILTKLQYKFVVEPWKTVFFQKILLPLKTKTVKILSNQHAKPKYIITALTMLYYLNFKLIIGVIKAFSIYMFNVQVVHHHSQRTSGMEDLFLWLQVNFFIWENSPRLLNLTPIFAFGNCHSHCPPPSTQKKEPFEYYFGITLPCCLGCRTQSRSRRFWGGCPGKSGAQSSENSEIMT